MLTVYNVYTNRRVIVFVSVSTHLLCNTYELNGTKANKTSTVHEKIPCHFGFKHDVIEGIFLWHKFSRRSINCVPNR